jgi:RAB protein geranylgeranyltransferase component A
LGDYYYSYYYFYCVMEFLESGRYDCVVIGTGLVESLTVSALCLEGKKVLHLDERDFYGGATSSANLEQACARWEGGAGALYRGDGTGDGGGVKCTALPHIPSIEKIAAELTSLGVAVPAENLSVVPLAAKEILRVVASSQRGQGPKVVSTSRSSRSCHPAVFDYAMERLAPERLAPAGSAVPMGEEDDSACTHPAFFGYRKDKVMTTERAYHQYRHFSIDENPRILLSYGKMVDAMLTSGVSSYIEFVSIEGIYIVTPKDRAKGDKGAVQIVSVPCSKADVFKSKLLTGLEKRTLMKLLQLAVDFGNSLKGVDESYQNESTLVQGRALHRPQNTSDAKKDEEDKISEESLKNKSFSEFLCDRKIPSHLQDIVKYAMCLSRTLDFSARDGLEFLYRHIYASGRLGETAFLYPIYGTTEIPESFCRSAAVRGAVYALRQNISAVVLSNVLPTDASPERKVSAEGEADETGPSVSPGAPAPVPAPASVPAPGVPAPDGLTVAVVLGEGSVMSCDKLVIGASEYREKSKVGNARKTKGKSEPELCQLTRVCVCTGEQFLSVGRGIAVLPPNTGTLGNMYPVFVLQLNSSAMVCPKGCFLLYVMTLAEGVVGKDSDEGFAAEMQRIVNYLSDISAPIPSFTELYFHTKVSTYTPASIGDAMDELGFAARPNGLDGEEGEGVTKGPSNCGVSRSCRGSNSLVMDEAVDEARRMCSVMYPDCGFFTGPILASPAAECEDEEARILNV